MSWTDSRTVEKKVGSGNRGLDTESAYSVCSATLIVVCLFVLAGVISYLTPPFQSPDEFAHLQRAYLLSNGDIFLGTEDNVTGGEIDIGLLEYERCFETVPFHYGAKVSKSLLKTSKMIAWSGKSEFTALPNTAAYFPLTYTPQALALLIGRYGGLHVSESYYLARFLSLLATLALLWGALMLFPVPPLVIALFVTPMTLFQLGSASLDAMTFGLATFAAALFKRGYNGNSRFGVLQHIALATSIFLLATSRIVFVVMTLLPLALCRTRSSKICIISATILLTISIAWILYAVIMVRGATAEQELSTMEIGAYYLLNPAALAAVFGKTLTNGPILEGYWRMFIGILGWLDTPLDSLVYVIFAVLLFTLAVLSVHRDTSVIFNKDNLSLIFAASVSWFLLFLVELVSWTPHPADVIQGVQGRYFYPILIVLCFAVCDKASSRNKKAAGLLVVIVVAATSLVSLIPKLVARY